MKLKIHHIGYAVYDINESVEKFKQMGFVEKSRIVEDELRGVRIKFMEKDGVLIELIAPLSENSPINGILNKIGPTPYHICYEVDDIEKAVDELKNKGFIQISKIELAPAIGEKRVVFLYSKTVGLVELVEK